jgi:predicted metalloprotease with PDZ domain
MVKNALSGKGNSSMRWVLAAVLGLWIVAGAANAAPPAPGAVAYRLSPEFGAGGLSALRVEVRFRGDASGRTRFGWFAGWAGDDQLWSHARDLKVEGGQAIPDGPGAWIITAAPDASVVVSYRVISAYDRDPDVNDSRESKPVIRPGWFYSVGEALFAHPAGRDKAPASFVWSGAPKGFGFASDLEHLGPPGGKAARPGTVDDVLESIVIGGRDLRLTERRIDGTPVRVATLGRYAFDPAAFEVLVLQVLQAEREFWSEPAHPFLVAMSPIAGAPARQSYAGTGRADAFALWVDPVTTLADLRWLLAHEYFHTWNPGALGGTGDEAGEASEYWFSEGFTDYYAWKLMLASGQFSPVEFAAKWNQMLRAYAASPVRAAPNSRILADFWTSEPVQRLPYQRGAILAAVLDARARQHGSSLDAVMRQMRRRAARPGVKLHADELFPIAYRDVVGVAVTDLIVRHMIQGEPLALAPDTFGTCFRVETREAPVFERGWDSDATRKAGQVIIGLSPDSAAYAAGLRDGMKIVEFVSGRPGEAAIEYVMRVQPADGPERLVRFLPAGKARLSSQQLSLVDPAATGAACLR